MKEKRGCPINNGADMHADDMLNLLFDDGEYVLRQKDGYGDAVGFIDGISACVTYWYRYSYIVIDTTENIPIDLHFSFPETLKKRLEDDDVEVELTRCIEHKTWVAKFYYREDA